MVPNRPLNGHYPSGYQQYYQQAAYPQAYQQNYQQSAPQQMADEEEIIITVKNEDEILKHLVAAGKTQFFLIAGTTTIWGKKMGQSLLEPIQYKRYKIVEDNGNNDTSIQKQDSIFINEFRNLRSEMDILKAEFEKLKGISLQFLNSGSNVNMPVANTKEEINNEQSFI